MFFFPIEISHRELISKYLLACKFAENGHTSYFGTKKQIWESLNYTDNPIYFDKGYHEGISEKLYLKIKERNGSIVSLDEENGVDLKNNNTLQHRFPKLVEKYFDLIFLWGSYQLEYLSESNNFSKNKLFSYGHPRFELLKPEFHELYSDRKNKIKTKYGDYILINTSFGLGNNILGEDFVINNYESRIPNVRTMIKYEQELIDQFNNLVKYLSRNLNQNIIVRPHPEENTDKYNSDFVSLENVHVIYENSVIPWIIGANIVIHHSCTTAVEAKMMGVDSIAYGKSFDLDLIPWLPLKMGPNFKNKEDVLNHIENREKQINFDCDQLLEKYFSFNQNSTELIVSKTLQTLNPDKTNSLNFKMIYFYFKSNFKDQLKNLYHYYFENKDKLGEYKSQGLSWANVKLLHKKMIELGYVHKYVNIKKINSKLFKVYKS